MATPPNGAERGARGRAWLFGDHVSTDTITPGRFNVTIDPAALASAAFCEARPAFHDEVRSGDVVVAGRNFGCGSSRESAPRALAVSGVAGVVAESYARIFYRNAVSIGLPVYVAPGVTHVVRDGDAVTLDVAGRRLVGPGGEVALLGVSGFLAEVLHAGGIVPYVQARGFEL